MWVHNSERIIKAQDMGSVMMIRERQREREREMIVSNNSLLMTQRQLYKSIVDLALSLSLSASLFCISTFKATTIAANSPYTYIGVHLTATKRSYIFK